MAKAILILALACIGGAAPARAAGTVPMAATDSCGPSFLGIYDFQVGDVFQDMQSQYHSAGGQGLFTEVERKFRIVSRESLPNGYRYMIEGLSRTRSGSRMMPKPVPDYAYGRILETREYLDTAGHRLDACKGRVVALPPFAGASTIFYTRAQVAVGDQKVFPLATDTTHLKFLGDSIGRPGSNLYWDQAGANPVQSVGVQYSAVYAAGLGCVALKAFSFETLETARLDGHIRGRDTLGFVSPDETFLPPASARREGAAGREPDRAGLSRTRWLFAAPDGSGYRDPRGSAIGNR